MTRRHDRARFGPAQLVFIYARSALAATRQPMTTPRHARHNTPRSTR